MIEAQNKRVVVIVPPQARVDGAAFTTAIIDTLGARYVAIYVALGDIDAALAALKVQESDAANMAGATDVPGADFAVAPAALPGAGDDNKVFAFFIDMRGRKRYLDLAMNAGDGAAGTFAFAWAELSRLAEMPRTAAQRGLSAELIVPTI